MWQRFKNLRALSFSRSAPSTSPQVQIDFATSDVCTLRLGRGKVNALNLGFIQAIRNALTTIESNPEIKGLVLASSISGIFSAGLDLSQLYQPKEDEFKFFWGNFELLWQQLYITHIGTVAAISGHSYAGGAVLCLACDYRIMSKNLKYKFGLNEAALGLTAPLWLQEMTASTIGKRQAERFLQQGLLVNAQDALSVGFLDEIVEDDDVLAASIKMATQLAGVPIESRAVLKRNQRYLAHSLAGPRSIDMIWRNVSSPIFQERLLKTLERLK